jgi:hypothetical protein
MNYAQLHAELLEHFRDAYDEVLPMRPPRGLTNADVNRAMLSVLTILSAEIIEAMATRGVPTARSDLAEYLANEIRLKSARAESLGTA